MSETRQKVILLIDDDEEITSLIVDFLQMNNVVVEYYNRAENAVKDFAKDPNGYALVICDLNLPDMRGDSVFYELRKQNADLPFVISTGYIDSELEAKLRDAKITDILNKPYKLIDLLKYIGLTK